MPPGRCCAAADMSACASAPRAWLPWATVIENVLFPAKMMGIATARTRFIGELLRIRGAGGLREAGFVIGGLGIGGLLYGAILPVILRFAKRPAMMATGGAIGAVGLAGVGLDITWAAQMAFMVVLGFGFFLLHNSVQTEVTELAPSARASSFSLHAFSFFLGPCGTGPSEPRHRCPHPRPG
jgi:hypothetical protein